MKKIILLLLMVSSWGLSAQQTGLFHKDYSFSQSPFNGDSRRFSFYVPASYDSTKSYPLIIGLHACGSNSNAFRSALRRTADSLDAIIACPDANGDAINNEYGGQEIKLIEYLYDSVSTWYSINPLQVYLSGFSCNGREALFIALEGQTDIPFAGVLPYAGAFNNGSFSGMSFENTRITPACFCMGDQDFFYTSLPFYQSVLDSMSNRNAIYKDILMPGVGHTTNHANFTRDILDCFRFLQTNTTIGLNEISKNNLFQFEVQANNLLILKTDYSKSVDCNVFDGSGRFILSKKFNQQTQFRLPQKGIYLIQLIDEEGHPETLKISL